MNGNWVDFFSIVGIGLLIWGGVLRGVVMEFFEFLIVTVGVLLTTHVYGFLTDLLVRYLSTPSGVAATISILFFFILIAILFWIIGGKTEAAANIPPSNDLNKLGGAIFAFMKGCMILWIFFFSISTFYLTDQNRQFLHSSPSVRAIQGFTETVDQMLSMLGSKRAYHVLHPLIKKSIF